MSPLLKYLKKHLVAKTAELNKITKNRMAIKRAVNAGEIQNPLRGYYCLPSLDCFTAGLIIVSKYYKKAIISGITAARYYQLSDENLEKIDIDIPNTENIQNSFFNVKRINKNKLVGISKVNLLGHQLKIYDRERTLIDLKLKYSQAIFYKALKRYVKANKINTEKIREYEQNFSTKVLAAIAQELADE